MTVRINLFALEKYKDDFDSQKARLWIKGSITHADTKKEQKFNDAGELVTILGRWNAEKLRSLKKGNWSNVLRTT